MSDLHVDIDLYADWVSFVRNRLGSLCEEFCVSSSGVLGLPEEDMIHTYLAMGKYLVPQKPRHILKSKEFSCPPGVSEGLSEIENAIRNGQSITPHLSRGFVCVLKRGVQYYLRENVRKSPKNKLDRLFIHWGVHHLHLGSRVRADGFINRTGPLLFCRFDNENAYFIGMYSHGSDFWTDQDIIRIIHDNWPESIERHRARGVVGLSRTITNESVKRLRLGNVNTLVEVGKEVVYMPPGGGVTTSGHPVECVFSYDRIVDKLKETEEVISENVSDIIRVARDWGINPSDNLLFKLNISGEELCVKEANCGFVLSLSDDGDLKIYNSLHTFRGQQTN